MIARKYLYLIALAREKHFGRAAAACHVSPSTLSASIRDLEGELGVAVVERGQQFSGLTPEGKRVVEYAQQMAASAADLRQELAALRDGLTGRLRLGVIPTALTVVADLSVTIIRRHPHVSAEVLSLSQAEILDRLRHFEIDAGIVYVEPAVDPAFAIVPVWHERHVLLTAAEGPFAGREAVTWHDAAAVSLCLLTPDMQNRKTINAVFAKVGVVGRPTLETNSMLSILAHVSTGHWSSIVPRSTLERIGLPPGVVAIQLVDPTVDWVTGLVTLAREPRPPMVAAAISAAHSLAEAFRSPDPDGFAAFAKNE